MKRLSSKSIANLAIPNPTPSEQLRVVERIRSLDVLTEELGTNLPAEIEARRKQYEYYRDQLLTFKELPA